MLVFHKRGNWSTRRKTSQCRVQTQPSYDTESGNRTRATLVGGEGSLHCSIPSLHHFWLANLKKCASFRISVLFCLQASLFSTYVQKCRYNGKKGGLGKFCQIRHTSPNQPLSFSRKPQHLYVYITHTV